MSDMPERIMAGAGFSKPIKSPIATSGWWRDAGYERGTEYVHIDRHKELERTVETERQLNRNKVEVIRGQSKKFIRLECKKEGLEAIVQTAISQLSAMSSADGSGHNDLAVLLESRLRIANEL